MPAIQLNLAPHPHPAPWSHFGGNRRVDSRRLDKRLALVRFSDQERVGVSWDISLGGIRVCMAGGEPLHVGQEVDLSLAFCREVIDVGGRVVHVCPARWGSVLGIEYSEGEDLFQAYLSRRYGTV